MKRRNMMTRFTGEPGARFDDFDRQPGECDEVELRVCGGTILFTVLHDVPDSALFDNMRDLHGELTLENGLQVRFTIHDVRDDVLIDVTDRRGITTSNSSSALAAD